MNISDLARTTADNAEREWVEGRFTAQSLRDVCAVLRHVAAEHESLMAEITHAMAPSWAEVRPPFRPDFATKEARDGQ